MKKILKMLMSLVLAGTLALSPVQALALNAGADNPSPQRETPAAQADVPQTVAAEGPQAAEWAMILYMCGSDLEHNASMMTDALVGILNAKLPDNLEIVAITGGTERSWDPFGNGANTPGYITPNPNENGNEIFWIKHASGENSYNQMVRLTEAGKYPRDVAGTYTGSMGNAEVAIELLNDNSLTQLYASEHIMLNFLDHGFSWYGAEQEEAISDCLDLWELNRVAGEVKKLHNDKKIDIVGFNNCLMSNFEVACWLKDSAEYLVASEEIEYAPGWRYDFLDTEKNSGLWTNGSAENVDSVDIGKAIVDTYIAAVRDGSSPFLSATLAVTDLNRIDNLKDKLNDLAQAVLKQISDEQENGNTLEEKRATYVQIARAAENSYTMSQGYGLVDMYDFLSKLVEIEGLETYVKDVINALGTPPADYTGETTGTGQAVLYRGTCYKFRNGVGLTVFYPSTAFGMPIELMAQFFAFMYNDIGLGDSYGKLVFNVVSEMFGEDVLRFNGTLESLPREGNSLRVAVNGDPSTIKKAEFVSVYSDFNTGKSYLLGSDLAEVDWNTGTLSKEPYEEWFKTADGKPVTVMTNTFVDVTGERERYTTYTIPVRIKPVGENSEFLDGELSIIYSANDGEYGPRKAGIVYTTYVESNGVQRPVQTSLPSGAVEYMNPKLLEFDFETNSATGEAVVYENTQIKIVSEDSYDGDELDLGGLTRQAIKGGTDGYYVSYFKVTDLGGNTFLSDAHRYILIDSYDQLYLAIISPMYYDQDLADDPAAALNIENGYLMIKWNGINMTDSIFPDPSSAEIEVSFNEDKTEGTVKIWIQLEEDETSGWLEGHFPVYTSADGLTEAYMELVDGAYAVDPAEYGENNKHVYGECTDWRERMEHADILERFKGHYEMGYVGNGTNDQDYVDRFKTAYDKMIEDFDASLIDGDIEIIGAVATYSFATGLRFTAEQVTPSGNSAYQSTVANLNKVKTYRLEMTRKDGGLPVKLSKTQEIIIKLALTDFNESDLSKLRLYYMKDETSVPERVTEAEPDGLNHDGLEILNAGIYLLQDKPYIMFIARAELDGCYFVLGTQKSGSSSSGGGHTTGGGSSKPSAPAGDSTSGSGSTPPSSNPFTDVPSGSAFYDAILWAVENGITSGTSATAFSPDSPCTRAQIVTFLWRAKGQPAPVSTENPFTDIDESSPYYQAILWAVENGITNGTTATTFDPDSSCTRAQAVTFQWRAAGQPAVSGSGSFQDVTASSYYSDAVAWAVNRSITYGTSATTFDPDTTCTRAQIVTFLYRDLAN